MLNLLAADLWQHVERIAPLTGRDPVPEAKRDRYRFEPDKFGAAGLTAVASELVRRVHAHDDITVPGTNRVDTERWNPMLYVFRHYFGTSERLGKTFKAEY